MLTGPERWLSGRAHTALPEDSSGGSHGLSLQLQGDLSLWPSHTRSLNDTNNVLPCHPFRLFLPPRLITGSGNSGENLAFFVNIVLNARTEKCICSMVGLGIIPHTFFFFLKIFSHIHIMNAFLFSVTE